MNIITENKVLHNLSERHHQASRAHGKQLGSRGPGLMPSMNCKCPPPRAGQAAAFVLEISVVGKHHVLRHIRIGCLKAPFHTFFYKTSENTSFTITEPTHANPDTDDPAGLCTEGPQERPLTTAASTTSLPIVPGQPRVGPHPRPSPLGVHTGREAHPAPPALTHGEARDGEASGGPWAREGASWLAGFSRHQLSQQ